MIWLLQNKAGFLEWFVDRIDSLLDSKTHPGLDGIIELTYWYRDLWEWKRFNTTLFQNYCWVDLVEWEIMLESTQAQISPQQLKDLFLMKTQWNIDSIQELEEIIMSKNDIEDIIKRDSILEAFTSLILLIQYAQNSIDFEIEKIWFDLGLSEEERIEKRKKNEEFENILYGWKISENKVESELTLEFLDFILDEYKKKTIEEKQKRVDSKDAFRVLSYEELWRLESYIEKIRIYLRDKEYSLEKTILTATPKSTTQQFFESINGVKISRDEVIKIFNGVLGFYSLPQQARVWNPWEFQSIYDSPTELVIPNTDAFATLWVERVLKLISHEIMCHYMNQQNHEKNNGSLRYFWNVEKEEGLAILAEKGLTGSQLLGKDLITPPFARILAWEILTPHEFEDFIDLFSDVSERKSTPSVLKSRHKRNQEDNITWVQHKDVAYVRGLIANIEYLKNSWDIEHLFAGKVWLKSIIQWNYIFDSESMIFPFLITDVFLFFLLSTKWANNSFTHTNFVWYIQSKYGQVIKKESFSKINTLLGRKQIFELFQILQPLFEAVKKHWIQWQVWDNIVRIERILEKNSKT